ncbi:MAG: hypothetical protein DMG80_12185 [Acidobacteria bacterium]|nr:MAG: hypothetical protein DMG80_12185 [Acidobacteriota bacterium]
MPTKIINTLTGLVLLLAVAAPLHAGSILNHEMTVFVPFGFVAGDRSLPPGDYSVQVNPERGSVVLHQEGRSPLILLTNQRESANNPSRGKLVFKRYGANFFLSEVWNQDNATGQTLTPSAAEKEMAHKKQPEQILVVQAR